MGADVGNGFRRDDAQFALLHVQAVRKRGPDHVRKLSRRIDHEFAGALVETTCPASGRITVAIDGAMGADFACYWDIAHGNDTHADAGVGGD